MTIICCNEKLSLTMSWVGCLLKDSELFILFAENSQILLKIEEDSILNNKEISPFAWYDIIMISREFSQLREEYRARVARIV